MFEKKDVSERLFTEVLQTYKEKAPTELRGLILPVISDDKSKRREWILKGLGEFEDSDFIHSLLMEVKDPEDPHLYLLLDSLRFYERPEIRAEFERVMKDNQYSESDRLLCEYLLEQRFGKSAGIGLKVELDGSYSQGYPPPVPFRVLLINNREDAIQLRFGDVSEILGFWVSEGHSKDFVKPKAGVQWFAPGDTSKPVTTVVIGKGETHELTINLLDYFDFTKINDIHVSVFVRCKIPGIHELPFSSFTGHGVPIMKEVPAPESSSTR